MAKECEVDILDIDKGAAERRLREMGAKYKGHTKFRRIEFLIGRKRAGPHSWARVRTDGRVTTITVKRFRGKRLPMEEHEVEVGDFESAVRVMGKLTRSELSYFENERDSYELGRAKITIDKWPGIPHLIEIEGPSMAYVKNLHKKLGITGEFRGNAHLDSVYKRYKLNFKDVVAKDQSRLRKILDRA
jgi:adenylate cyclase class IV